jgi:hypothetical protein
VQHALDLAMTPQVHASYVTEPTTKSKALQQPLQFTVSHLGTSYFLSMRSMRQAKPPHTATPVLEVSQIGSWKFHSPKVGCGGNHGLETYTAPNRSAYKYLHSLKARQALNLSSPKVLRPKSSTTAKTCFNLRLFANTQSITAQASDHTPNPVSTQKLDNQERCKTKPINMCQNPPLGRAQHLQHLHW